MSHTRASGRETANIKAPIRTNLKEGERKILARVPDTAIPAFFAS
jgi:hypothetical protein